MIASVIKLIVNSQVVAIHVERGTCYLRNYLVMIPRHAVTLLKSSEPDSEVVLRLSKIHGMWSFSSMFNVADT